MTQDKFTAVWVSHSSMGDFLKCSRAYYLNNVYKDKQSGHKITLMSPPLALGQAVHEVVESLSVLPVEERFKESLQDKFDRVWKKVTGKKGGFFHESVEERYKSRGKKMIERVAKHPGPLKNKAVKIQMDLPHFWLSEEDNIILCGKVDWLEYIPESDSVHIIDFKTSTKDEDPNSLQLPIYHLLVHNTQKRKVAKASYWYLDRSDELVEKDLPDLEEAKRRILEIAKQVKLARALERFKCPHGENGCYACRPFEAIVRGQAQFVGVNDFKQDMYVLEKKENDGEDSIIL